MAWRVEFDPAAVRELGKLDPQNARRILTFLHSRVAVLDDPRSLGEALKGSKLGEFWKYRVGDCRICLLYTSPSPRDVEESRMPSSA